MMLRTGRLLLIMVLILTATMPFSADDKKQKKNSDIENIGNRNINKRSINFISIEKEIALGREMAAQIERDAKLIQDPAVNEYVNRVGQNIVRNSDAKVPFTIKVIESDEVNAFALPGGFFYVNTGLILAADDEAELAAVMAHEIAHVAARHGTENASKAQIVDLASIPLILLGGGLGLGLRQAAGFLIPMQFLQFSRKAETEADYLGVQYLYKTGYDPSAAVTFFEKLQAKEKAKPGTMSKLFSTHPPTADRVVKTKDTLEQILPGEEQYVVTTSEFLKIKELVKQHENRLVKEDENRPSLKRKTHGSDADHGNDPKTKDDDPAGDPDRDDRPTLKRRNPGPFAGS